MSRVLLPQRRFCRTFPLRHTNQDFIVSIGFYEEGKPAEVFVTGTKAGSDVEAVSRDGAILLSLALQHGVPINTIRHAITRGSDDKPSSIVGAIVDRVIEEAAA